MDSKKLTQQLIETANVVRQKYKSLKSDRNDRNIMLEKTFKPITKTLKKYSNAKLPKVEQSEKEPKFEQQSETDDEEFSSNNDSEKEDDENDNSSNYYLSLLKSNSNLLDKTYGVRFDANDKNYKIGSSTFEIIGESFRINDTTYVSTLGLLELLFLKKPEKHTSADLAEYVKILRSTSAHKRNFNPNEQTKGTTSNKYKKIIKPLLMHNGGNLMNLPMKNVDYIYWNDPNEMVDRLRLLLSSQQAGHSNHNNEILSITEELRESNIII